MLSKLREKDCEGLSNALKELDTSYLIGYDEDCEFLKNCNLKEKITKQRACLYYY